MVLILFSGRSLSMTGSTPSPGLGLFMSRGLCVHNQSFKSLSQGSKVWQAVGESIPTMCSRMRTFTDGDYREGITE